MIDYKLHPELKPDPLKCGQRSRHWPELADFPCILDPGHETPHQDKLDGTWNLDGSRTRKV